MSVKIRSEISTDMPKIEAVTISAFLNAPHASHAGQYIVDALRSAPSRCCRGINAVESAHSSCAKLCGSFASAPPPAGSDLSSNQLLRICVPFSTMSASDLSTMSLCAVI
jgi:hypothetical protein